MKNRKIDWIVIIFSILAFGFLVLAFYIDWLFLAGAIVLIVLNQRRLFGKS
jgi:hypothetical protein